MKVPAPAKVNLTLKILGRRPDGYHDIETFMVPLTLEDTIEIELTETTGTLDFCCDDPDVPSDEGNLVARAVKAFRAATGRSDGLRIRLHKNIPHGAGLGGGSSDAASTLLALDNLLGTCLPAPSLESLATGLGSDVPFFLRKGAALCTGRGERINPSPSPVPSLPILLLKPPFGVPTPSAYASYAEKRSRLAAAETIDLEGITMTNDLEPPVFHKYLLLAELKSWLRERDGVRAAMMSGSGSTVFAVLSSEAYAGQLASEAVARFGSTLWTCSTRLAP